ncbi:MAG: site-specific integrase [Ruminococcaceae bacterium]|nr:site-specific integrase [Oscillospiraceae bacterium]
MKRITGHLTERNKKWYAVINLYDTKGRRKEKWTSLDLDAKRGTKTEATHRMNEILAKYNTGELYLMESLSKAERERKQSANMLLSDYLVEWLEQYKPNIAILTYQGYKMMVDTRMVPYFSDTGISVKDTTGDDLNEYYYYLYKEGLTGATAQRHHSLLHLAFKNAVKRRIITTNPCDQADRPKATQYIGSYYNADELKTMIEKFDGDPMRLPVILTAYYGLRRSEVLGLKWDAIDYSEKKIVIRHKIIEVNTPNGKDTKGMDVLKTKSSYRTLPLIPYIEEVLNEEKVRQAEYRKIMRSLYNEEYNEYICVDALGNLIKPQYITEHFKFVLRKNNMKVIRFHDLRHSCASLLLANGVPMKMIQDWLGHSDMSTTANIYAHIDSASKLASANTIGNALANCEMCEIN